MVLPYARTPFCKLSTARGPANTSVLAVPSHRWVASARILPHLLIFRSYTVIEFFHHADERCIFVPEGWIIPLLLNQ